MCVRTFAGQAGYPLTLANTKSPTLYTSTFFPIVILNSISPQFKLISKRMQWIYLFAKLFDSMKIKKKYAAHTRTSVLLSV